MNSVILSFIIILMITNVSYSKDLDALLNEGNYDQAIVLLKKQMIKNPSDSESFYLLNKLYLHENRQDLVDLNMDKYYPRLNKTYNKILFSPLRYKNYMVIEGGITTSSSFTGENAALSYLRQISSKNYLGLSFLQENRNFNGSQRSDSLLGITFQRKTKPSSLYSLTFSTGLNDGFFPETNLLNQYYFKINNKLSGFVGLRNSIYSQDNELLNTIMSGFEYYRGKNIFHLNGYLLFLPSEELPSISISHSYYFNYRSILKTTFSFGKSLDDIDLFGPFHQFTLRYSHKFPEVSPYIQGNYYHSDFREEFILSGGIEWRF